MRVPYATLLVLAAGCAAPATVPPPGMDFGDRAPMSIVESPSSGVPANDIPESKRREWYEAQRPKPAPVTVERVVVREREPRTVYVRDHDYHDDWLLPLSLSVGWWGGHRRGNGWGWGLGWHSGWRNGWCW